MTNEEMNFIVESFFNKEGYVYPTNFEHRVDPKSLSEIYSYIRYKSPFLGDRPNRPCQFLQIGTWEGGTTLIIMAALKKNRLPFNFIASELLDDKRVHTGEHSIEMFQEEPTLIGDITKNLDKIPNELDFLFHDTDHDETTTQWVLDNIFPRLRKGALVIFHDWAVEDINGKWVAKDGAWAETNLMVRLHTEGKLPLEKVYFNFRGQGSPELGIFKYVGN